MAAFFLIFKQSKVNNETVNDQMRTEKKNLKKVRKNLSNFDTRIISSIRASPSSFARILTNEFLYQDFRFDSHSKIKHPISKQEQERIEKSQS
jgi:hypothetical protein